MHIADARKNLVTSVTAKSRVSDATETYIMHVPGLHKISLMLPNSLPRSTRLVPISTIIALHFNRGQKV